MNNAWKRVVSYVKDQRTSAIIAAIAAAAIFVTGGAAFAARQASDGFADATFSKLGGSSDEVLNKLADRVVKKLSAANGPLGGARQELVSKISKAATDKIGNVDPEALLAGASDDLMAAGIDKIGSFDLDAVIAQVTDSLIAQATAEIEKLDLNALAKGALDDLIKSVDIEKLIKQKLDSIDVEKLASDAIAKQLGGGSGGLLATLLRR